MEKIHSASDSYLGYIFQGYYALLVLLDAEDDSSVSIETSDDIVLNDKVTQLIQVKHRNRGPKVLSEKSIDFWKTIRIWASEKDFQDKQFILITCDKVKENSPLIEFTKKNRDIKIVKNILLKEAERVLDERNNPNINNNHNEKYKGCQTFLDLSEYKQTELLKKIYINAEINDISKINKEVIKRIKTSVKKDNRSQVSEKIIEWWGKRIVKALKGSELKEQEITMNELSSKIEEIIVQISNNKFIISYENGSINDESIKKAEQKGAMLIRQIELIDGEKRRRIIALRDFWKASIQRHEWMKMDISICDKIEKFDEELQELWEDEFYIKKDDNQDLNNEKVKEIGRQIFDFISKDAWKEINPKIDDWANKTLVNGSYQRLANELNIGWHFDYKKLLNKKGEEDEE